LTAGGLLCLPDAAASWQSHARPASLKLWDLGQLLTLAKGLKVKLLLTPGGQLC
jgi:hypothetical protein